MCVLFADEAPLRTASSACRIRCLLNGGAVRFACRVLVVRWDGRTIIMQCREGREGVHLQSYVCILQDGESRKKEAWQLARRKAEKALRELVVLT